MSPAHMEAPCQFAFDHEPISGRSVFAETRRDSHEILPLTLTPAQTLSCAVDGAGAAGGAAAGARRPRLGGAGQVDRAALRALHLGGEGPG